MQIDFLDSFETPVETLQPPVEALWGVMGTMEQREARLAAWWGFTEPSRVSPRGIPFYDFEGYGYDLIPNGSKWGRRVFMVYVGRSPNQRWTCGYDVMAAGGGFHSPLSIRNRVAFSSELDAFRYALRDLRRRLRDGWQGNRTAVRLFLRDLGTAEERFMWDKLAQWGYQDGRAFMITPPDMRDVAEGRFVVRLPTHCRLQFNTEGSKP